MEGTGGPARATRTVDPSVTNLDQLSPGDRATTVYVEQMAVYLEAPGMVAAPVRLATRRPAENREEGGHRAGGGQGARRLGHREQGAAAG